MTFKPSKNTPPVYDIIFTSNDLNLVGKRLEQNIIKWLTDGLKKHVLVYVVSDQNPRMVSYELIKSLRWPSVEIFVGHVKGALCAFNGDREFGHSVKANMPHLLMIQAWYNWIQHMELDTIKNVWIEQFQKKPKYRFQKRKKMLKMLRKQSLRETILA